MTIVCNKEIRDISFLVLRAFPVRDLFAYLPLVLILNYNVGKMGVMCWPLFFFSYWCIISIPSCGGQCSTDFQRERVINAVARPVTQ